MPSIAQVSGLNLAVGELVLSSQPVPIGITRVTLQAERDDWPDDGNYVVEISVEASTDGGSTWFLVVGSSTRGGIYRRRDGTIATENVLSGSIPEPDNSNRFVRAKVNVLTPIRTSVTLSTEAE